MSLIVQGVAIASVAFCLLTSFARADEASDAKLFEKVMNRLLNSDLLLKEYPEKFVYPPKAFIKPKSEKEVNAYASAHKVHGAEFDEKSGKIRPVVMVTQGLLNEVIKSDENSLAVIMGHELAHLTKDHVGGANRKGETAVVILSFGRDQEIEADLDGMRYAIAGGYPYKKGVSKAIREMRLLNKYTSFEGLNATHPTWEERMIFLDREQSKLWASMSAFQNGYLFLELEQYQSAQQCFKAVIAEFPDCHEAWANLGYARLMQYCDGMDYDDLKRYDLGQIVTGGFYARPESLESSVRGIDEKLWKDAVSALNKSLLLNPELVLPRASLGVAYLVHPEGRDLKKAKKCFAEAHEHLKKDTGVKSNPQALIALLINGGVADMAAGDLKEAARKFQQADGLTFRLPFKGSVVALEDSLFYNRALLKAKSSERDDKMQACKMLESYLLRTSPNSAWWPLAYARYAKLGKDLDIKTRSRPTFMRQPPPQQLRTVTSVAVGKRSITLSEPTEEALSRLGKDSGDPQPLFPDAKITRWRFADKGIDVLAKDKVLAIFLTNPKSPPVLLQQRGVGGDADELKVGMSESLAKQMLKDQFTDSSLRAIADSKIAFHFYPDLGIAVRYEKSRVQQIAIAQLPRRVYGETQFSK